MSYITPKAPPSINPVTGDPVQEQYWLKGSTRQPAAKSSELRPGDLAATFGQLSHTLVEGRKDDSGKSRMDLLPPEALFAVAQVLSFGANKYGERNWEHGMSWGRVFGALMRHMWAWWAGKAPTSKSFLFGEQDDETKFSHLWHAGCCIMFLIAYEERGSGTDDRFVGSVPDTGSK